MKSMNGVFIFFLTTTYAIITVALKAPRMKTVKQNENHFATTADRVSTKTETANDDLLSTRIGQTGPNVSVFYKKKGGLVITQGDGIHMIDENGKKYLDCCNNVACVGHSHPAVVKAGCDELGRIQTNGRFLHPTQQRYLSKLLATFPSELNTVYLVNSGSEANDLALRIAQQHNTAVKKNDVIVLDHAYHGHTGSLIGISPYKWYQAVDGINRQPETTHLASCPDSYRGKHRLDIDSGSSSSEEVGALYAQEIQEIVERTGGVGTFIAESVVGCGGQIILPDGYLRRCYEYVRRRGGVCIADEVQTGFARAGSSFWAFQEHGVIPDIVTLGKPMGNGYPVAAVVCRRELADSFASTGIEYFNTYGGNSVACAIAEAVLDTILSEDLQSNSLKVGEYLLTKLKKLAKKHSWIGDVRGMGLFLGIEFVKITDSKDNLQPHTELCGFLVDFLMNEMVLVSSDGPDANVIKIKPPLVFSIANADTLITALEKGLLEAAHMGVF
jgi:ethanolamine-phosphate phospho-lyase